MGFKKLPEPVQRFALRHKWKLTITFIIFALLAWGYYFIN